MDYIKNSFKAIINEIVLIYTNLRALRLDDWNRLGFCTGIICIIAYTVMGIVFDYNSNLFALTGLSLLFLTMFVSYRLEDSDDW